MISGLFCFIENDFRIVNNMMMHGLVVLVARPPNIFIWGKLLIRKEDFVSFKMNIIFWPQNAAEVIGLLGRESCSKIPTSLSLCKKYMKALIAFFGGFGSLFFFCFFLLQCIIVGLFPACDGFDTVTSFFGFFFAGFWIQHTWLSAHIFSICKLELENI